MTPKPKVDVIAELCCNHMGDFNVAKEMIRVAMECGAWAIKLQKRNPKECLSQDKYNAVYNSEHSFGVTYGEHREKLEFTIEQHEELRRYAASLGVVYTSSVWDITSYRQVAALDPPWIKIPSAHNEDRPLLDVVAREWSGAIHISNGMASRETEMLHSDLFGERWVPYVCTSTYPTEFKDVNLLDIERFYNPPYRREEVGYSGHHLGIAIDIAAACLGARYIERHFTLDRTWKGTDQAASLEPAGLKRLIRDLQAVQEAWNVRCNVLSSERPTVAKLKVRR